MIEVNGMTYEEISNALKITYKEVKEIANLMP